MAALALWSLLHTTGAVAGLKDYPLRFEVRPEHGHSEIVVRNDGPSTISARLTLSGDNVASDRISPMDIVVPRYTAQRIVRVWPADPQRTMRITYRSSHHFGDAAARHDPLARYRMPFEDGKTFRIDQYFGGRITTHNTEHDAHAIDIAMPEETPIVAARAGIVVDVTLDNFAGAADPSLVDRANSVTIQHDDGTVAQYAHLAPRAALVSRGQHVAAGDRIGLSGNTGYSSGPHLHFSVSQPLVNSDGAIQQTTLPVTFFMHNPPVPIVLRQGMLVTATYDAPFREPERASGAATSSSSSAPRLSIEHAIERAGASSATSSSQRSAALLQELMHQRSGLPTWAWIVILLGIWLLHRARRRSAAITLDAAPPRKPRVGSHRR